MIDISSQQQLALLFPSSNKAVSKILEGATPEQLNTLSEAKDLKAVLSQLMSDTLDADKSNKIILDILKNSNFFKELGNFSKELKALIDLLTTAGTHSSNEENQSDANKGLDSKIDKIIKLLQSSLIDISSSDSSRLKDFVKNSGLFLESKFLKENSPVLELKSSLEQLKSELAKSDIASVQKVLKDIETLLQNPKAFDKNIDTSSLGIIKKDVENILAQLKNIINLADPIYSKDVQKLILKLEQYTQDNGSKRVSYAKDLIHELISELRTSPKDSTKSLVNQLENIENKIQDIVKESKTSTLIKNLSKELESIIAKDPTKAKDISSSIEKLKLLSKMPMAEMESINHTELKTFFTNLSNNLNQTNQKSIFDLIEKILSSLKQPAESFELKKIPQDIKNFLNNFEKEINKGDVLFSKGVQTTLDKISLFSKPAHLLNNTLLQQDLQRDMKALLLGLEKELGATTNTFANQTDAMKTVEKLLVQIDYFQLVSHLSNSSYMYLPFSWEQLEDGKFCLKKLKDGSFYCEIDLQLKEYGKLNMMLQLFEENQLNIMVYTEKDELKSIFKENMQMLRSALVSVDIMPRNIRLHDLNKETKRSVYEQSERLNELGFEVKG